MLIPFLASTKSLAVRSILSHIINKYSSTAKSYSNEPDTLLPKYKFQKFIQPKLSTVDSQSRQIIIELSQRSKVDKTLVAMMDKYLNVLEKNNSPLGLLAILITLKQIKGSSLESYCRRIIEFILRTDVSLYKCDYHSFRILLSELEIRLNQSQQKVKVSVIKYFIIQVIIINISEVNQKNITTILKLLNNLDDRGSVSQYTRFLKLSNLLQERLHTILKFELQTKGISDQNCIIAPFFISHALNFYFNFPPYKDEYTESFFCWLKQKVFDSKIPMHSFVLYNCYKSFPYKGKSKEGIYYKDLVLQCVLKRRKLPQIHSFQDWNQSILCYAILSFQFYKIMNQVQFHYEGTMNYLLKEDVLVPTLPSQFWSIYKKVPSLINNNGIMYNIIKQIYPQRYVKSSAELINTIKPPLTENEMKLRLDLVCQKLGLKRQRQIQISGRYVDFLIEGNIVIECDGDHHFNMHSMDYDEGTQFRNLHILLLGYKLILINIFEYNANRDLQSLAKLISQKIECLRRTNAILVI